MPLSGFSETSDPERGFQLWADIAPVMIRTLGPGKLCDWLNRHWLEFTGRRIDQELGNGWAEGVHPNDLALCLSAWRSAFDRREEFSIEYRLRRHDGIYRWVREIGRPYFMFEGEFRGYIGSGIDISDSKAARKALQTMQSALERNSRFVAMAASIAHEVSQPLAAVLIDANAGLRWLARSSPNLEEARAALTRIVAEGNRASEVVQGIRAMLKRGGEQSVPVAVNDLVLEVLTILDGSIQSHRITVQTELSDPLPQVLGDRVQLQEVILNLITNAVESMDTLPDRERVLRVTSQRENGGALVLTIEDSGSGIDAEYINRVFDAFFTTKAHGLGIGLSICRTIVERHGGRLWVTSGSPRGSIFHVRLPIRPRQKAK